MDVHFTESIKFKNNNIKLIFFDLKEKKNWDTNNVNLLINTPVLRDTIYNIRWILCVKNNKDNTIKNYKVKKNGLNIHYFKKKKLITDYFKFSRENYFDFKHLNTINNTNPIKFFNLRKDLLTKLSIKDLLIDNGYNSQEEMTNELFDKLILTNKSIDYKFIPIYTENKKEIIWSINDMLTYNYDYFAICVLDDMIIGRVTSKILSEQEKKKEYDDREIMYPNMNLYISHVDIHPWFQGNGLCRPLLTFMLKHLRNLGYEMLYIANESETYGGVPACICYYKSGIDNNYRMRYADRGLSLSNKKLFGFKPMTSDTCFDIPHPSNYYYISEEIGKRGKEKFKNYLKKK